MRERLALLALGVMLGLVMAAWSCLLAPAERHGPVRNAYYPYSVEMSVRDR